MQTTNNKKCHELSIVNQYPSNQISLVANSVWTSDVTLLTTANQTVTQVCEGVFAQAKQLTRVVQKSITLYEPMNMEQAIQTLAITPSLDVNLSGFQVKLRAGEDVCCNNSTGPSVSIASIRHEQGAVVERMTNGQWDHTTYKAACNQAGRIAVISRMCPGSLATLAVEQWGYQKREHSFTRCRVCDP